MQYSLFFSDNSDVEQYCPPQSRKSNRIRQKLKEQSQTKCKLEQPIVPSTLPSYVSQGDPAYDITKDTLYKIFFEMCDEVDLLRYSARHSEPSLYFWIFTELVQDLKYRQLNPASSSKMRSSIVKRIVDDFVREGEHNLGRKEKQRMTAIDRRYYEKANIDPPPSNINSEYIAKLFQNETFKAYFQNHIQNDRLTDHFLNKCYQQVSELIKFVQKCTPNEQRSQAEFSKLRKPMTLSEIRNYQIEAYKMLQNYCK